MHHHLRNDCRTLYDSGIRCQIALQNCKTAGRAVRIIKRTDDFRIQVLAAPDIFANGLSGDGHAVQVQQILLGQLVHDCVYAACLIKILDVGRACRSQMAYIRGTRADLICDVHIQLHTCLMCDCWKMQHTVC